MNRKSILEELKRSKSLRRWELQGINLSDADMSGADLTGARFEGCSLRRTRFDGAVLHETAFIDCRMDGASFQGVSFVNARFDRCRGLEKEMAEKIRKNGGEWVNGRRASLGVLVFCFVLAALAAGGYYVSHREPGIAAAPKLGPPPSESQPDPKMLLSQGLTALGVRDY